MREFLFLCLMTFTTQAFCIDLLPSRFIPIELTTDSTQHEEIKVVVGSGSLDYDTKTKDFNQIANDFSFKITKDGVITYFVASLSTIPPMKTSNNSKNLRAEIYLSSNQGPFYPAGGVDLETTPTGTFFIGTIFKGAAYLNIPITVKDRIFVALSSNSSSDPTVQKLANALLVVR